MSSNNGLTTTSYAILGLLAIQPWSTYELTRQMNRSVGRMWPRAASKLYEEPKKLERLGLATATGESVGRRARTVYAITPAGRQVLASWLGTPGAGPVLEFEQLLQLSFAENGTRADALATVRATKAWAVERNAENLAVARAYAAGEGELQHRAARGMLAGAFFTDFYAAVARWADWATVTIEQWPDDPGDAQPDLDALAEILRRASWSEGLAEGPTEAPRTSLAS